MIARRRADARPHLGLADYLAADEQDCIRIGRRIVARLNWRKKAPGPVAPILEPRYDAEELTGIVPPDLKDPVPTCGR